MTDKEPVDINSKLRVKDFFLTQVEFELVENTEFGFFETRRKPIENK